MHCYFWTSIGLDVFGCRHPFLQGSWLSSCCRGKYLYVHLVRLLIIFSKSAFSTRALVILPCWALWTARLRYLSIQVGVYLLCTDSFFVVYVPVYLEQICILLRCPLMMCQPVAVGCQPAEHCRVLPSFQSVASSAWASWLATCNYHVSTLNY
jgi:hypothetical protein